MRRAALVAIAVLGVACSERKTSAPAPATTAAATATATATATAAAPQPAAAAPAPAPPGSADEKKMIEFCAANYKKLDACFNDDSFWQILATLFFAQNPSMDDGQPRTRAMWIGMRKDDFAGLIREKRVAADCEASLRHNRWPSPAVVERVSKARDGACPAFANAFGTMIFVDGAFNQPR